MLEFDPNLELYIIKMSYSIVSGGLVLKSSLLQYLPHLFKRVELDLALNSPYKYIKSKGPIITYAKYILVIAAESFQKDKTSKAALYLKQSFYHSNPCLYSNA